MKKKIFSTIFLTVLLFVPGIFLFNGCSWFGNSSQSEGEQYLYYMVNNSVYMRIEISKEEKDYTVTDPQIDGYSFNGWYKNSNYTQEFDITDINYEELTSVYAFAKMTPIQYTINYDSNQGVLQNAFPTKYTVEENIILPTPVKEGYVFLGWCKTEGLSDTPFKSISAGAIGNLDLYAKYQIATYSINYHNTKSSQNINSTQYTINDEINLTNLSKEGYLFKGWYDNENYSGSSITKINSGTIGNKDFYAKWEVLNYSITYNLNGGGNNVNNPSNYNIETETIILVQPTKEHCNFEGWYTDENLTSGLKTNIPKGSVGNVVLYAKWSYNYTRYNDVGEGTQNNPYLIYTAAQYCDAFSNYYSMDGKANEVKDKYFRLECDICITNINIGIGEVVFNGVFNGNNKTITISDDCNTRYIFPGKLQGEIKNLKIKASRSSLLQKVDATGVVKDCEFVENNSEISFDFAPFVILNYGTVENCVNNNSFSSTENCGGIVYRNYGLVKNCVNNAMLSGKTVAGIAVNLSGSIENCSNYGSLISLGTAMTNYVGGIVSYINENGTIKNCANYGSCSKVGNNPQVGGIVGALSYGNADTILIKGCKYISNTTTNANLDWIGSRFYYENDRGINITDEQYLDKFIEGSEIPQKVSSIPE